MSDTISRQAVFTALVFAEKTGSIKCGEMKKVFDVINSVPSIEPQTGKWISVPFKRAKVCSCCRCDEPYKFADDNANIFNYCPNCGAKMEVTV